MKCRYCKNKIKEGEKIYRTAIHNFCSKHCKGMYTAEEQDKIRAKKQKDKEKEKKIRIKEKKLNSIPRLVKQLDDIFSKYIRTKYSKDGKCECISCGKTLLISEAHNCHWINRGVRLYRWDEDNCRPGCSSCNLFNKEFHLREYTIKQIEMLGNERINEMRYNARQVGEKPLKNDLIEKIEYFKNKLKELG